MSVRISNRDIVCQIFSADLTHDVCLLAAYAHELPRYGIKVGLTNYSAAYATGLLLARRVNSKLGLDYEGVDEVTGEEFHVEADAAGKAPFKALLDVGLRRTTTGARVFGALKGACDGGLDIPHTDKRFPGTSEGMTGPEADPEVHRNYIFGGHVQEYMESLMEDDEEAYNKQFSKYIELGVGPDDIEGMYEEAHTEIRADPFKKRDATHLGRFSTREGAKPTEYPKKNWNQVKLSKKQRAGRVRQKLKNLLK